MFTPFLNMMGECCRCWCPQNSDKDQVMVCCLVLSEQLRQPSGSGSRSGLSPWLWAAQQGDRGEMELYSGDGGRAGAVVCPASPEELGGLEQELG